MYKSWQKLRPVIQFGPLRPEKLNITGLDCAEEPVVYCYRGQLRRQILVDLATRETS